ncbi:hypothetical protein CKM354_001051300 [Cercospora kikuchii]|uniref:DUF6604 domain-containing protein n=1 Tax=Cercospora kikuchii TaxID=84275 RepID=A0A9P3CTQ2_9PEZI|nr:uncharacterized protein CKM354_001051300 [Cercospora kikuchii]GIZ47422.1 hypothetical protein CKM354_001051300 [Cercospora kikuchii]
MAPNAGWNTYRLYKEGTTKLTTWLVDNALRCRAEVQTNAARHTDDSAASSKSKYTVPLTQFVAMANAIVNSAEPRIRIPQNILTLVKYIISLRKHAANFFTKMASNTATAKVFESNIAHRHFIMILEQVLNILDPSSLKAQESGNGTDISNVFSALAIEEPAPEGTAPPELPPRKSKDHVDYEPGSDDSDQAFAVFAFFDDLNSVREYISGVWVDYAKGELDVMSAAVTTDTGFRIIKDKCEALMHTPAFCEIRDSGTLGGDTEALRDWTCANANNMLISFVQVLHPHTVPVLKPDHFGVYRPELDRSAMSQEEQQVEDLIVTMNLLQEFTKLSRVHVDLPVEDELTWGIRFLTDTCDARQMPMFTGFAFQILLDIHNSLRDHIGHPLTELQNTARRAVAIMDDYFRLSEHARLGTWAPANDEVFRMIKETAEQWALEDTIAKIQLPVSRRAPKMESFYLLKNHPVLAGLLMFQLNLRLQDAGITLCNAWRSVLYTAHLYNALRQSGGLNTPWRDIEYIIETHSAKRLFVGAPPSEPSDYLKRFIYVLGGSASTFARDRRQGGSLVIMHRKGPRGLKTTTPVRDVFQPRYVGRDQAVLSKANLTAMLSVATKARRTSSPSEDLETLHAQVSNQSDFTPAQVLHVVREGMAGEEHHLVFNYIGLHFRSFQLLRKLQTQLSGHLPKIFGSNYIEHDSELASIIGYIFRTMSESDHVARSTPLTLEDGNIVHAATEITKTFLEDGSNAHEGLVYAKIYTSAGAYHISRDTIDQLVEKMGDEW